MYSLIPLLIIGAIAWIYILRMKRTQKTVIDTEPRILSDPDDQPQADITCPHCSHHFEKMPVRKRKCPACREWIWPKRPPGKQHKQLVTVEQAEAWEVEWEKQSGIDRYNELSASGPYGRAIAAESMGEDFFPFLKKARREELKSYKHPDAHHVRIVCDDPEHACRQCKNMNGAVLSIRSELVMPHLPHDQCTCVLTDGAPGFCRCRYEIVFDDEV